MEPYHIVHDARCQIRLPNLTDVNTVVRFVWSPSNPAAMVMRLFDKHGNHEDWVFARSLIGESLGNRSLVGDGDVQCQHIGNIFKIYLTAQLGQAIVVLDTEDVRNFWISTVSQIAPDCEHYEIDDELERWVNGPGGSDETQE